MLQADLDVIKTQEFKNDLESFIYDSRSKVGDNYAAYVTKQEE